MEYKMSCIDTSQSNRPDVIEKLALVSKTIASMCEVYETFVQSVSLKEAQEMFYSSIQSSSQTAFAQILSLEKMSADQEVKSAIYLVAFSSMSVLLEHVENSFGERTVHCINITMLCCLFLSKGNWHLLLGVVSQESSEFLESKHNAMQSFILRQSKANQQSGRKLKLLRECANHLRLPYISKKLETAQTSGEPRAFMSNGSNNKQVTEHSDICHDGTIYTGDRDPPGQRSIYIHPGDDTKESYRLSTFLKFSRHVPVDPRQLAEAGFLFTGYRDRVRCFSCGSNVYNWCMGDDVKSARWHRSACPMARGEDDSNVPLPGRMFINTLLQSQNCNGHGSSQQSIPVVPVPSSSQTCFSDDIPNNVAMASSAKPVNPSSLEKNTPLSQRSKNSDLVIRFAAIQSPSHEALLRTMDLRKEENRLKTFENWSMEPRTVSPHQLAQCGFFYLGNLDRVQCFSCEGVFRNWKADDNVEEEHRAVFPYCKMVLKTEARNVPLTNRTNSPPSPGSTNSESHSLTEAEIANLQNMFPCQHAVNPHLRNEGSRLETFDSRWKHISINLTPRHLAQAGFFFLGERDRVKCWYCNGGLQNWEPNENPWTEHAKWFPMCEFLLQSKGPDFVHSVVSAFPNISRPTISGQSENGVQQQRLPSPPPAIVDPRAENAVMKKRLNEAMVSKAAKEVEEMGFDKKSISRCIKGRLKTNSNTMYGSTAEMVGDLLNGHSSMEDSDESDCEMETMNFRQSPIAVYTAAPVPSRGVEQGTSSSSSHESMSPESTHTLQKQIRELVEQRRCKICLDSMADVVFTPCGHLCSCMICAPALKQCPICRMKIGKAIRTYQT